MFDIKTHDYTKLGLRKRIIDYSMSSADPVRADIEEMAMTTTERFRLKTSGLRGGREPIQNLIRSFSQDPRAANLKRLGEAEVYEKLIIKLETNTADFDESKMQEKDIIQYVKKNLRYLSNEINTKAATGETEISHSAYTTESDQKESEGSIGVTDAYLNLPIDGGYVDPDAEYNAKENLIKALEFLKQFQETTLTTPASSINAVKLIQAYWAHEPFAQLQVEIQSVVTDAKDFSTPKATSQTKQWASLGIEQQKFIKTTVIDRFEEMLDSGNNLAINAYRMLVESCDTLGIDLVFLDAELIMEGNYINKLRQALTYSETAIVTEYDLEEISIYPSNFNDLKMSQVNELINKTVGKTDSIKKNTSERNYARSIALTPSIKTEIDNLNLSQFRNLPTIVAKVHTITNTPNTVYYDPNDPTKVISKTQYLNYKQRQTSLLTGAGIITQNGKEIEVRGPLHAEVLPIILNEIKKFKENLLLEDIQVYNLLQDFMIDFAVETSDLPNGHALTVEKGFFVYKDTGLIYEDTNQGTFFETKGDSNMVFNKWILHESGFYVSKYLDAKISRKTGATFYRAPENKNDNISQLIIKTIPVPVPCTTCGRTGANPECKPHNATILPSLPVFTGTKVSEYNF